ncbi:hypothetical protein [Bdellovibrio sp. NC01]|uniref:hypothetical protein n=1 Tax=Bdellovibrio sp. NC01 TaxID=2220073 RepID=UPI0011588FF3|nr:hypothetical protein [Bdellovibrio sp. NC01]QDK37789.1 hypothetical protein DOE51_09425 [Bdellovibrio sp. NC01]
MKSVLTIAATAMAFSSLVACSNLSDNSLLTDEATESSTHTVDNTPNSTEIYLQTDSTSLSMVSGATTYEISGSCYTSTYPTNQIAFTRINTVDGTYRGPASGTDIKGATNVAVCRNGRFNYVGSATSLDAGMNTIKMVMTVYDSSMNPIQNDANSVKTISVIR